MIETNEVLKHLGAKDQGEYLFWEKLKSQGFEVPTAAVKGNPIGKRWDRAIRAKNAIGEQLREDYGKKADGNEKAEFRK
eukprot:9392260-Pyramimonas_sp.AAC.1